MRRMNFLLAAAYVSLAVSGCAVPIETRTVTLTSTFDESGMRAQMAKGTAKIAGNAFMRQQGGGVVTCAGQDVILIAANEYSAERLQHIYGIAPAVGQTIGRPVYDVMRKRVEFTDSPPAYTEMQRKTKCDSLGNFEFTSIKAGDYYIITGVVWQVQSMQGGTLVTRVRVSDENPDKVIMSL